MNVNLMAAISKAAVPQTGARRFFNYEVSKEEQKALDYESSRAQQLRSQGHIDPEKHKMP